MTLLKPWCTCTTLPPPAQALPGRRACSNKHSSTCNTRIGTLAAPAHTPPPPLPHSASTKSSTTACKSGTGPSCPCDTSSCLCNTPSSCLCGAPSCLCSIRSCTGRPSTSSGATVVKLCTWRPWLQGGRHDRCSEFNSGRLTRWSWSGEVGVQHSGTAKELQRGWAGWVEGGLCGCRRG